jgi:hypothetical protein
MADPNHSDRHRQPQRQPSGGATQVPDAKLPLTVVASSQGSELSGESADDVSGEPV